MATRRGELTEGEQLSLRIKEVRQITGKKQAEFASIIGVSRSYLSEVEACKSKPSIEMILGVATHFPEIASPSWFLLGYGRAGPYRERLYTEGLDLDCVRYCLRLLNWPKIRQRSDGNAETTARVLTLLISHYVANYQVSLLDHAGAEEARNNAEGRTSQVASMIESDFDQVIATGPTQLFELTNPAISSK